MSAILIYDNEIWLVSLQNFKSCKLTVFDGEPVFHQQLTVFPDSLLYVSDL